MKTKTQALTDTVLGIFQGMQIDMDAERRVRIGDLVCALYHERITHPEFMRCLRQESIPLNGPKMDLNFGLNSISPNSYEFQLRSVFSAYASPYDKTGLPALDLIEAKVISDIIRLNRDHNALVEAPYVAPLEPLSEAAEAELAEIEAAELADAGAEAPQFCPDADKGLTTA
jgi:hypothetical protein